MNEQNYLLQNLKDIHIPNASIFPFGFGWYILIAFFLLCFLLSFYFYKKRKIQNKILHELNIVINSKENTYKLAASISLFLKRFCIYYLKDNISSDKWFLYLLKKNKKLKLSNKTFNILKKSVYINAIKENLFDKKTNEELKTFAINFIKKAI